MTSPIQLGIPLLDKLLPKGVRRDSLIVMAGDGGTGKSYLAVLFAAKYLERGEPVVYLALDDDPRTLVDALGNQGLEAEKLVYQKKLILIDAYGPRYGLETESYAIEQPLTDLRTLYSGLTRQLDQNNIAGQGLLVIDSLNPLLARYEPTLFLDFINMVRAGIAKKRIVTVLATLHTPTQYHAEIAANLECIADVFIWLRYHPQALEAGYTVREVLVKKAKGVPVAAGWTPFIITDEGPTPVQVRQVRQAQQQNKRNQ